MSVNLCIDWGNTNVKAAIFNDNAIQKTFSFSEDEAIKKVSSIIELYHPAKCILCSVTRHSSEFEYMLKERVHSFLLLDSHVRTTINNAYSSPETLGPDRLGLVVAAYTQFPDKNNLIISAGTCITYSFINKNKTFRGGAITPGIHMRLKAMTAFTGKLPEVSADLNNVTFLGYDTESCLKSGALYGAVAEIDGFIKEYEKQYPDFNAILTGGDAPLLASKIKSKIFADPDILLKGLNLILNYNVPLPR